MQAAARHRDPVGQSRASWPPSHPHAYEPPRRRPRDSCARRHVRVSSTPPAGQAAATQPPRTSRPHRRSGHAAPPHRLSARGSSRAWADRAHHRPRGRARAEAHPRHRPICSLRSRQHRDRTMSRRPSASLPRAPGSDASPTRGRQGSSLPSRESDRPDAPQGRLALKPVPQPASRAPLRSASASAPPHRAGMRLARSRVPHEGPCAPRLQLGRTGRTAADAGPLERLDGRRTRTPRPEAKRSRGSGPLPPRRSSAGRRRPASSPRMTPPGTPPRQRARFPAGRGRIRTRWRGTSGWHPIPGPLCGRNPVHGLHSRIGSAPAATDTRLSLRLSCGADIRLAATQERCSR